MSWDGVTKKIRPWAIIGNWLRELRKVVAFVIGVELAMRERKDQLGPLPLVSHCLHL